ncbi:hypothetical protein FOZ63_026912 [Perkinsus olseni]|uniref:Uncharacterized protein n=1 Tax=Perkinsus olseni TaxID=32597 RepID=A0A7J6U3G3_PEROL|nr:hypothetical protein FOZ63_026912 [Perkinsus olseni]
MFYTAPTSSALFDIMSFIDEFRLTCSHALHHPDILVKMVTNSRISSWSDLLNWSPPYLKSGTAVKLHILLDSPEVLCLLWLQDAPIWSPPLTRAIMSHLSPSTWRSYKSSIRKFLRWHWHNFPGVPALPANPESVREFLISSNPSSSFFSALTKVHHLLHLAVDFHDPFTLSLVKGVNRQRLSTKRDKSFLNLDLLHTVSSVALQEQLRQFQALLVISYAFSLRVPSELLDPSNRIIASSNDVCQLILRHRKKLHKTTCLTRICTCHTWGALLCPVNAAKTLRNFPQPMSSQLFNRLLRSCLRKAGVNSWRLFSSHAPRRGRTNDLHEAHIPDPLIDASGGWSSSSSKYHYLKH